MAFLVPQVLAVRKVDGAVVGFDVSRGLSPVPAVVASAVAVRDRRGQALTDRARRVSCTPRSRAAELTVVCRWHAAAVVDRRRRTRSGRLGERRAGSDHAAWCPSTSAGRRRRRREGAALLTRLLSVLESSGAAWPWAGRVFSSSLEPVR